MPWWWGSDRIGREADAWVARLHGTKPEHIASELSAWRASDPRHEAAFRRSEALWQATGSASRIVDAPHVWAASRPQPLLFGGRRLAIASVVAAMLAASGAVLVEGYWRHPIASAVRYASKAEPQTVRLADGSVVRLEPNSLIVPHFDGRIRGIDLLRGSARFDVAHDAARPFVVTAAGRTVTARGTIFEIALQPAGFSVTMIEGVVDVAQRLTATTRQAQIIRLRRGQQLVVAGSSERMTPAPMPAPVTTSRDYAPTALARVIEDANRGAVPSIRLGDATLGAIEVQGRFDLSDTTALARQLAVALGLELREDAHGLTLSRPPRAK